MAGHGRAPLQLSVAGVGAEDAQVRACVWGGGGSGVRYGEGGERGLLGWASPA